MKIVNKCCKWLVPAMLALALAACDGDGEDAPVVTAVAAAPAVPAAPVVVTGSATGVLSDAAVGGVAYTTSSGVTGTTAADGSYSFNPGDTVTFKLGGLTLGTATATGIITPMELSGVSAVKLQNLLVLLQSLDSDGNPANGISIPAGAAAAVAASVNLDGSTATFASDAGVQAAMTAGGIAGAPKSVAAVSAHFLAQGLALLSGNIWFNQSTDSGGQTHTAILRIDAMGKYVQIETGSDKLEGSTVVASSGVEAGTLSVAGFSPSGFNVTATIATDSNGQWGVSGFQECDRLRNVGDQLVTIDCNSARGNFSKMQNVAGGIVGAWFRTFQENGITLASETYYFANGTYVDTGYTVDCVGACPSEARFGTYTLANGLLTAVEDGSADQPITYSLLADGNALTLDGRTDRVLTRISK
jgi:hypothetical protein